MIQQPQRAALARPVRIQRKRTKGWRMPANTVCVDRSTAYGNFVADWQVVGRERAVALFVQWLLADDRMSKNYKDWYKQSLRGKNLACWCPLVDKEGNHVPCHADVLLEMANPAPPKHTHQYERLSLCCGAQRQDRVLALYDADLEPVCSECAELATFVSVCWCGDREDGE